MNAAKELLECVPEGYTIVCASIVIDDFLFDRYPESSAPNDPIVLKEHWTDEEFDQFIKKLDFDYNNSYGTQFLHGVVLLNNGAWLERGEYDGSEWWNFCEYPEIPAVCERDTYYCPKCGGLTRGGAKEECGNPACPNMPCCGKPKNKCFCKYTKYPLE